MENELILVILFDKEGVDEKVVTHSQLLKVCVPSSGTAESLFHAVTDALKVIGVASSSKEDCDWYCKTEYSKVPVGGILSASGRDSKCQWGGF